jgi:hypothetical protein
MPQKAANGACGDAVDEWAFCVVLTRIDEGIHSTAYPVDRWKSPCWASYPKGYLKENSMSVVEKQPGKAAFEIKKGVRQVMTLSETEVEKYLDLKDLLDGLEDGFRGLELGEIQSSFLRGT